jgi:hypothetical protein
VDQAGHQSLEQLPLAEHDHRLVLDALRHVVEALDGLAQPDERDQQPRAAVEERAADRKQGGERERSGRDVYEDRSFPSSAVTSETISIRTAPS